MNAFTPFPGFDPLDGAEPGITLSADNPLAPRDPRQRNTSNNSLSDGGEGARATHFGDDE